MKTLMIVRHAKSDWDDPRLKDFDRPLNRRGLASASEMAQRLIAKQMIPQYMLSSPALRAKTTSNIFAKELGLAEPSYNDSIYESSYNNLLGIVNNLPDAYDFVAVFGHNPGISSLLCHLTGKVYDMPTCAIAVVRFEFDVWNLVGGDTGELVYYDYPMNE